MADTPTVPPRIRLVKDFVNTRDLETGTDELAAPGTAAAWLVGAGLAPEGTHLGADDLDTLVAAREAIRALLLANAGQPLDAGALRLLDQLAAHSPLVVRMGPDGSADLDPHGSGTEAVIAALLAAMVDAMREGTWSRLKACAGDDCHWAFYDHSRNRSGTWCSMAVCGNRAKARAFRKRRTAGDRGRRYE